MKNNLFAYATSELSQDAFICYLSSFGLESNNEDPLLHECAKKLMTLFVPEIDSDTVIVDKVERQTNHIDVLLTVHDEKRQYKIVVEDKIYTSEHDNQLQRYSDWVKQNCPTEEVRGVYYKTGFQCNTENIKAAGYNIISRETILQFFKKYVRKTSNQIIIDYYEYWQDFQLNAMAYEEKNPSEWDWSQIDAFFEKVKNDGIPYEQLRWVGFGYVANKSGGFRGLWTGDNDCTLRSGNAEYSLYIQIEAYTNETTNYQICLKLCSENGKCVSSEDIRSFRNQIIYDKNWKYSLTKYGFDKPSRIGSGKHMTIGVYQVNTSSDKDLQQSLSNAFESYEHLLKDIQQSYR